MKKITIKLLTLLMVFSLFTGCGAAKKEAKWTIKIEGAKDSIVEFTDIDAEKLKTVEIEATQKKKDGTVQKQKWTGIPVKEVLNSLGVSEYKAVVVESSDGYNKEFDPELIGADGTILGLKVEGKELDEKSGPVQLVVDGKGSNWWVKQVTKIQINK